MQETINNPENTAGKTLMEVAEELNNEKRLETFKGVPVVEKHTTPDEPFKFFAVKIFIDKKGYKRRHLKSIVRTQYHGEIRPAIEKFLVKYLEETQSNISSIDARPMEHDFFLPETKSLIERDWQ